MRQTIDHRGESFWDVFPDLPGQINISRTMPLEKRGFHLHKNKTDYWFVLEGTLKVILMYPDDLTTYSEREISAGQSLTIAPNIWHAYQNVSLQPATMIYYETAKSGPERLDDAEMPLERYDGWIV